MQIDFVADRDSYDHAAALLAQFGAAALAEAASRAEHSRALGNHIHYTRWCRVSRAILMLEDSDPRGLLH